jgi:hypothetical protein
VVISTSSTLRLLQFRHQCSSVVISAHQHAITLRLLQFRLDEMLTVMSTFAELEEKSLPRRSTRLSSRSCREPCNGGGRSACMHTGRAMSVHANREGNQHAMTCSEPEPSESK